MCKLLLHLFWNNKTHQIMTFKNLLLGLANDPFSAMLNPFSDGEPLYKVEITDLGTKFQPAVSVRVETKAGADGDQILQNTYEYSDGDKDNAIEYCCEILFKQIYIRGAQSLHGSHSGPFSSNSK